MLEEYTRVMSVRVEGVQGVTVEIHFGGCRQAS